MSQSRRRRPTPNLPKNIPVRIPRVLRRDTAADCPPSWSEAALAQCAGLAATLANAASGRLQRRLLRGSVVFLSGIGKFSCGWVSLEEEGLLRRCVVALFETPETA